MLKALSGGLLLIVLSLPLLPLEATRAQAANESILGTWATQKNHGRVLIESCGGAICAKVVDGDQLHANPQQADINNPDPSKRSRPVKGLLILAGYHGGPTHWEGGTVYDPQTGNETSDTRIDLLDPNTLKVEGCKLIFCRSEIWTRLSEAVSPHG